MRQQFLKIAALGILAASLTPLVARAQSIDPGTGHWTTAREEWLANGGGTPLTQIMLRRLVPT